MRKRTARVFRCGCGFTVGASLRGSPNMGHLPSTMRKSERKIYFILEKSDGASLVYVSLGSSRSHGNVNMHPPMPPLTLAFA